MLIFDLEKVPNHFLMANKILTAAKLRSIPQQDLLLKSEEVIERTGKLHK